MYADVPIRIFKSSADLVYLNVPVLIFQCPLYLEMSQYQYLRQSRDVPIQISLTRAGLLYREMSQFQYLRQAGLLYPEMSQFQYLRQWQACCIQRCPSSNISDKGRPAVSRDSPTALMTGCYACWSGLWRNGVSE